MRWFPILLCLFGLAAPGLHAVEPPSVAPRDSVENWREMPTPELIKRLPTAGAEIIFHAGTEKWTEIPASIEMRRRLVAGLLAPDEILKALQATKTIAVRDRWPRGTALAISVRVPTWISHPSGWIQVSADSPNVLDPKAIIAHGPLSSCGLFDDPMRNSKDCHEVGLLDPAATSVELAITIMIDPKCGEQGKDRQYVCRTSFPVRQVENAGAATSPVRQPDFDRAVERAIRFILAPNQTPKPPRTALNVQLDRLGDIEPFLQRSACRARIEILEAEKVLHAEVVDLRHETRVPLPAIFLWDDPILKAALDDPTRRDKVTVRVTGVAEEGLKDLRRTSHWGGHVPKAPE